jgi:hypothetical protein
MHWAARVHKRNMRVGKPSRDSTPPSFLFFQSACRCTSANFGSSHVTTHGDILQCWEICIAGMLVSI